MHDIATVAALLFVPAMKTCETCQQQSKGAVWSLMYRELTSMKGKGLVDPTTASRLVMQKLRKSAHEVWSRSGNSITCKSYQNVMIIVMPMIPLANVAHLMNVSQRSLKAV